MNEWEGWPPSWPQEERLLEGRQTCAGCGRQLRGTIGRPVPGRGWMHKNCAVAAAAEFAATDVVYLLDEGELEDEEVP